MQTESNMKSITIVKQNYLGKDVWKYTGTLLEKQDAMIRIEAFFDREDTPVDKLILRRGDKFIETYFLQKWYNIYQIQDRENGSLKAWYCNVSFPPVFSKNTLKYRDLELDLLVYPSGRQITLDKREFDALPLSNQERSSAVQALKDLQNLFSTNRFTSLLNSQKKKSLD